MQYQDVLVQFPVSITLAMLAEAAFGRGLALSSTFLPEPASHWAGSWQERAQGQPGRNPGTLIHAGTATLTFPCLGVGTGHSESAGNQLCLQHLSPVFISQDSVAEKEGKLLSLSWLRHSKKAKINAIKT